MRRPTRKDVVIGLSSSGRTPYVVAAVEYARQEVAARPDLRCRLYDHQGLIGPPIQEIRGAQFKADSEISPRFGRWVGSILFFPGVILIIVDWSQDFRLSWPALIGTRMLIPGTILLVTEAVILLQARVHRRHAVNGEA